MKESVRDNKNQYENLSNSFTDIYFEDISNELVPTDLKQKMMQTKPMIQIATSKSETAKKRLYILLKNIVDVFVNIEKKN